MRLDGKTALISGAAHGIGRASAERFAAEGAAVVVVDIEDELGEAAASAIRQQGGVASFFHADITEPGDVEGMVEFACGRYGSLDILHNNAYVLGAGRAKDLERDVWQRTIDVCLTGYWYSIKIALGPMLEQGKGSIINTASVAGLAADYTLTAYSAAKAGVLNLTRVIALDYARKGIRCNAICPGPVWTYSAARLAALPEDVSGPLLAAVPQGRWGRPEEVANLALFLGSDESSFMTGAHCVIDGGMSAHSGMPPLTGSRARS